MALSGDGGKGYGRRPQLAPNDQVESNWKTIFGKKKKEPANDDSPADHNPTDNKEVE